MIIKPKVRGFVCVTTHPTGCAENVRRQIDHVRARPQVVGGPKRALILGAMTRCSASVGIFMVGNYLFAKGWSNPAAAHDKDFLLILLVVFIGAAGDYWGVDGWRSRRR